MNETFFFIKVDITEILKSNNYKRQFFDYYTPSKKTSDTSNISIVVCGSATILRCKREFLLEIPTIETKCKYHIPNKISLFENRTSMKRYLFMNFLEKFHSRFNPHSISLDDCHLYFALAKPSIHRKCSQALYQRNIVTGKAIFGASLRGRRIVDINNQLSNNNSYVQGSAVEYTKLDVYGVWVHGICGQPLSATNTSCSRFKLLQTLSFLRVVRVLAYAYALFPMSYLTPYEAWLWTIFGHIRWCTDAPDPLLLQL
ncbi:hypothetical protein Bhyg_08148 [Pseudolycoriella hygida]|uniref:Uncharacterized protein n=1 Tax=Pseudolycoriella hygida TaxID=35572 RepID=A0A9Q0N438_9DIPT|nr:hypothetical protein Bhyg_08148 [Pseudolycoriella hygida]